MNDEWTMNDMKNDNECIDSILDETKEEAPTDFNAESVPTTLLDAIDFVNETTNQYIDTHKVFDFAICHGNVLDYLARRLQVTPIEAFMFSICAENGREEITFNTLKYYLRISVPKAMALMSHLDNLVRKRLLNMTTDYDCTISYQVTNEVIRTLATNSDYQPPQHKFDNEETLLESFQYFIEELPQSTMDQTIIYEEAREWVNASKELHLCQEINKLRLSDQSVLILLYCCKTIVTDDTTDVEINNLKRLFTDKRELLKVKNALRSGEHELMKKGVIEHSCNNGIADANIFTLTKKARNKLLANVKLTLTRDDEMLDGVVQSAGIASKEMFYSEKVSKQVNDLQHFLENEKYLEITEQLKKRYKRAGLTCLLYGGPGTGKTETVYQLARETGRDILAVDFASIKSKFVGDSEKNIKWLFERYRQLVEKARVTPILLFNEADAILGTRMTGAKHSVDKMENAMQNIILQEMETFNGILIATTNLTENLDAAFERRFLYKVHFERPDEGVRARIWQQMLPELSETECETLGREYDLSGGQIENVARKFAIDEILHGKEESNKLALLQELCNNECIIDNSTHARRVGFAA